MARKQIEHIKGEVIGCMTEELQRAYAKRLARILLNQYGKEKCEIIVKEIGKKLS
jgi:hypothetical protein